MITIYPKKEGIFKLLQNQKTETKTKNLENK